MVLHRIVVFYSNASLGGLDMRKANWYKLGMIMASGAMLAWGGCGSILWSKWFLVPAASVGLSYIAGDWIRLVTTGV